MDMVPLRHRRVEATITETPTYWNTHKPRYNSQGVATYGQLLRSKATAIIARNPLRLSNGKGSQSRWENLEKRAEHTNIGLHALNLVQ